MTLERLLQLQIIQLRTQRVLCDETKQAVVDDLIKDIEAKQQQLELVT